MGGLFDQRSGKIQITSSGSQEKESEKPVVAAEAAEKAEAPAEDKKPEKVTTGGKKKSRGLGLGLFGRSRKAEEPEQVAEPVAQSTKSLFPTDTKEPAKRTEQGYTAKGLLETFCALSELSEPQVIAMTEIPDVYADILVKALEFGILVGRSQEGAEKATGQGLPANGMVLYQCATCAKTFEAKQGSRRFHCPDCVVERVKAGVKQD